MTTYDNPGATNFLTQAPRVTAWNTVASFGSYSQAQDAVDRLAAAGFPVEEIEIVGSDLRSVEHVIGRMTTARAVAGGAGTGAWAGLFIGLLVGLFTVGPAWLGLIVGGLVIGAVWGAIFGLVARSYGRGRHNFSSLQSVIATRYDVIGLDGTATKARSVLGIGG